MDGIASKWTPTQSRRFGVFVMCILVGLGCGSNYVFSAYAPQLASQLVITSTQVNLIGVAGNLGMYLAGPLWGKIVDSRGQRIPLLIGGLMTLTGYGSVKLFFDGIWSIRPSGEGFDSPPSSFRLGLLGFAMFLTGMGGSAGLTSSVNATAKSFPDSSRASATGTVLAGFGLSAFLFSTIGHVMYKGNAGGLLLLLAIGTSLPMLIGSFIIRPIPPTNCGVTAGYEPVATAPIPEVYIGNEGSRASYSLSNSLELVRSRSPDHKHRNTPHMPSIESLTQPDEEEDIEVLKEIQHTGLAYTPMDLIRSRDFHILFVILALLCGTGLMYINNAGTVALALARQGTFDYDKEKVGAWQAAQVATVSIWNCAGRILGGVFSDTCKTKFQMKRIWFLPIVAALFVISQVSALATLQVENLWLVSTLLGLSYGSLFNVVPMLVLEWFGMPHFSQNYGWICVAPVIGGNIFNLVFGRVYDSNTVGRIGTPTGVDMVNLALEIAKRAGLPIPEDRQHDCLVGENCYASAFKISTTGCIIAFGLSLWSSFRRERMVDQNEEKRLRIDSEVPEDRV